MSAKFFLYQSYGTLQNIKLCKFTARAETKNMIKSKLKTALFLSNSKIALPNGSFFEKSSDISL